MGTDSMVVKHERPEPDVMQNSLAYSVWKWMSGQEFNNVMLASILAALVALAWYGVPAMLKQIQDGYERINVRHAADLQQARGTFERSEEWKNSVIQSLLRERGIEVPNSPPRRPMAVPPVPVE